MTISSAAKTKLRCVLPCLVIALALPAHAQSTISAPQPLNSYAATDGTESSDPPIQDDYALDLAAGDNGTVIAIWKAETGAECAIMYARSTDQGQMWGPATELQPGVHSGRPQLGYKAVHIHNNGQGRWYAWWDTEEGISSYSLDDGLTWSPPKLSKGHAVGADGRGMMIKAYNNTAAFQVDVSRSLDGGVTWQPIAILPSYGIYHVVHAGGSSWFITAGRHYFSNDASVFHTEDNGLTWVQSHSPEGIFHMHRFASDHQGTVVGVISVGVDTHGETYSRTSTDNGRTWSISAIQTVPSSMPFGEDWADITWAGGTKFIAAWHAMTAELEPDYEEQIVAARIYTAFTLDAGQTWTVPALLAPEALQPPRTGQIFPAIAFGSGRTVIGWESAVASDAPETPYGPDNDLFYMVDAGAPPPPPPPPPVEPPPPPPPPPLGVDGPAPNLSGVWAPAEPKYQTNKKGVFKGSIKATFMVGNNGELKTDQKSIIRFYLSADNQLDASDVELKPKNLGKLKPGKGKSAKVKLKKLPAPVTRQHLIAVVDADQTLPETNETDNIIVSDPLP